MSLGDESFDSTLAVLTVSLTVIRNVHKTLSVVSK